MPDEFQLINDVITQYITPRADVCVGIGDDAAVTELTGKSKLVSCVDSLVAGVHFFPDVDVQSLGYKSLAVNISDFAAMGATPQWALLALTLPVGTSASWVEAFMAGFSQLAKHYDIALIGGDTTRGPLTISVTLLGTVGQPVLRSTAEVGDNIWLTGDIGDAAYAVKQQYANSVVDACFQSKLDWPRPQLEFMQAAKQVISSAIDLSDGLVGDAQHICKMSSVGAVLQLDTLPLSNNLAKHISDRLECYRFAAGGGDDYEILFTAPESATDKLMSAAKTTNTRLTKIGRIVADQRVSWFFDGNEIELGNTSYQHQY